MCQPRCRHFSENTPGYSSLGISPARAGQPCRKGPEQLKEPQGCAHGGSRSALCLLAVMGYRQENAFPAALLWALRRAGPPKPARAPGALGQHSQAHGRIAGVVLSRASAGLDVPVDPPARGIPGSSPPRAVPMELALPHCAPRRRLMELPRACAPPNTAPPRPPRRQDGGVCGTLSGSAASFALVRPPGASARSGAAGEAAGRGAEWREARGAWAPRWLRALVPGLPLRRQGELEAVGRGACWEL